MHINSSQEFDSILAQAGNKLVVVDFFATWCPPCQMIAPRLEELAHEFQHYIIVLKVDIDRIQELASRYSITSMPTFVFIKGSHILERFSGANYDMLRNTINRLK